jgi:rare lipoprotein A
MQGDLMAVRSLFVFALICASAFAQRPEQGLASWYGIPFDGQRAASGEIYRQDQLTAAHRTLPFGTTVRIRRTDTGASVVVRINDRGPFVESRIVDLSNAAAKQLRMVDHGVVPVALEVVGEAPVDTRLIFSVQAGTFRILANAERTRALLEREFGGARIVARQDGALWSVQVGSLADQAGAEALAVAVRKSKGLASSFVVRVDASALPVTE